MSTPARPARDMLPAELAQYIHAHIPLTKAMEVSVLSIEASTMTRIAFVDRLGQAFVPEGGTVLQEGDVLHVVAREDEMDRIAAAFAAHQGGH